MLLVLGLGLPPRSEAARLSTFLTTEDLSRAVLLDQNGQQLQLPSTGHPHPVLSQGTVPTYLAFPLYGGAPARGGLSGLPIVDSRSQTGQATVGPLDFSALVKAKLDTALNASGLAVVNTPNRNYVIEFLPRHVASAFLSGGVIGGGSTTTTIAPLTYNGVGYWLAAQDPQAGQTATQPPATRSSAKANSKPASELSQMLSSGSGQLIKWSRNGFTELEKLLKINNAAISASKPSLNLAAQELGPPLPAPIPEPSTWMVFAGLILGAAGLRYRLRQRVSPST
jgi:hypothetical protein